MSRDITLANLRTRIYRRANLENHTGFVPAAEAGDVAVEAATEVYDLLATANPDYFSTTATWNLVANTASYSFTELAPVDVATNTAAVTATDFYKLRSVHVKDGTNEWRPLTEINEAEEQAYRPPDGVYTVRMRYIPVLATNATFSSLDGVNGWEELAVCSGAIRLLLKEGTDPGLVQLLQTERARQEARIRSMLERNVGEPPRVIRRATTRSYVPEWVRSYGSPVDGYRLRAGAIEFYRLVGGYSA